MTDNDKKMRVLEVAFMAIFSALIFAFFFSFLGANGVIVGNDPAVHLQTAENFLTIGRIQISDIAWYTPLYHLTLDTFITFTGITSIGETMVLMKAFTALVDWLVVFSIYVVAAKFFGKRTGVIAAALMLLSFPFFELNAWGGYTTILSLAFIMLTVLFLTSPEKGIGNTLIAFVFAFSVVLSHQLATFLAAFIIPPFVIIMVTQYRSTNSKVLIAALLGGTIAFLIYYVRPILPYFGELVNILFFQLTVMQYQISFVSFNAFMQNFGFIFFFGLAGIVFAFFELRKKKTLSFYFLLVLTFFVPLFFSQSYLIGFNLSFPRFIDFLMPPLVVLAAVGFSFVMDTAIAAFFNNKTGWKHRFLKVVTIIIVVLLAFVMVLRFQEVSSGVGGVASYYSTSDVSAYKLGTWINQNFPNRTIEGVTTQKPGNWLADYTGRTVFAETNPLVDWNVNAECVLAMSYEFENPLAMTRVYEAKTHVSDEMYLTINMVWQQAVSSTTDNSYLIYREHNGTLETLALDSLNRTITMNEYSNPMTITITYWGENFKLAEIIQVERGVYPVTITWQLSAMNQDLDYVSILLNEYFNPAINFNVAKIPGVLNWTTPLSNPSSEEPGQWATTNFNDGNLAGDSEIDIYSNTTQAAYAIRWLTPLPHYGSLICLGNGVVSDLKFQYDAYRIDANYTVSYSYQVLAFSMSMYPQLSDLKNMGTLFDLSNAEFVWKARNYISIIKDNNIGFIVYDANQFDPKILTTKLVQLVYSANQYYVLKVTIPQASPNV